MTDEELAHRLDVYDERWCNSRLTPTIFAEAASRLRALSKETQVHRQYSLELSTVLTEFDNLRINHEGDFEAAWRNIKDSVATLSKEAEELRANADAERGKWEAIVRECAASHRENAQQIKALGEASFRRGNQAADERLVKPLLHHHSRKPSKNSLAIRPEHSGDECQG